jgi:hypothetical protein
VGVKNKIVLVYSVEVTYFRLLKKGHCDRHADFDTDFSFALTFGFLSFILTHCSYTGYFFSLF